MNPRTLLTLAPHACPVVLSLALMGIGTGCGSPPPPAKASSLASKPAAPDPKEQLLRETTTPLKRYPVRAFEGKFESEVEAFDQPTLKMMPATSGFDIAVLSIPLDKDVVAHCALRETDGDIGPSLARTLRSTVEGEKGARVLSHGAEVVYVRDTPILAAREILSVTRDGKDRTLDYSMTGTSRDGFSILCDIGSGGYAQTFLRVTSRFAAAMVVTNAPQKLGVEVWDEKVLSSIGYCRSTFAHRGNEGEHRLACNSIEFDDTKGWQGNTVQSTSNADKSGATLSEHAWVKIDPNPAFTVDVTRSAKLTYAYTIASGETRKSGTFASPSPVRRETSFGSEFKDVIRGKKTRFTFESFDAPPTKTYATVVSKSTDESILLTYDDRVQECFVDDMWRCKKRVTRASSRETRIVSSRVFVREPQ